MPDPKKFDLDYRPKSYWGPETLEQHFGTRITGEVRRQFALGELALGLEPSAEVLATKLEEPERRSAGLLHPMMLGGEYLPDLAPREVEIARAVLDSTTMDVISVRARLVRTRIHYRIVDEYAGDFVYTATPRTSREPLTFRQMIRMIDRGYEGGLDGGAREMNYREWNENPEALAHFSKISSEFYPALSVWFDTKNDEWLENEYAKAERERRRA